VSRRRTQAVALSSVAGIAQRAAQVGSSFIIIPILTRALGVDNFGVWSAATSLVWIVWTLDLGVGNALMTLVPRALAGRSDSRPADIVAGALLLTAGLSVTLLAAGAITLALFAGRADPAFVVAGVALAVNVPLGLSNRLWLAVQRGQVGAAWDFAQNCVMTVLLIAGALSGWTVWALVACVYGTTVAANGASLIHLMLRHPDLRPHAPPPSQTWRELLPEGGSMLGVALASTAVWALDNVLTLMLLGPAASASIAIALRLYTTASSFITAISTSLWPAFAEAATTDHTWVRRGLWRSAAVLTGLSLAGSLALALAGGPLLRLWLGRDLGVSGAMLWTVGAWVTAAAATQAPQMLLLAVSRARAPLIALAVAAAAGLVIKILFARTFGPAGMLAVNAAINLLVVLPVCVQGARAWLDSPGPVRGEVGTTA
jgi:O-antigen/teichoic acid export membrane protein